MIADLVPNGPKVLYDNDYVIVEGSGTYSTLHHYSGTSLIFQFLKIPSRILDRSDWLALENHDLKTQNLSFAIDTYFYDKEALKTDLCSEKSNPELKKLLQGCTNRTVIRELARQEKQQLQKFKEDYKGDLIYI